MHALTPDALSRRHGRQRLASRSRRQHRRRAPQRNIAPCIAPAIVEGEVICIRDDYQAFTPPPKPRKRVPMALAAVIAVLSLMVGSGLALWLSPVFLATATITLTPETHALSTAASIQIAARVYPADHESLSRTVATTGTAIRPASAGHGGITFYNGLPAPQTIPAGTLLVSSSGVPVLTEETAYIPAAAPPTEGDTTVSAQAENTGPAGNIAAGTIGGPCCRAYVLAYNGGFWGGADARTYRTPTTADIASAVASLRSQVDSRVQGAIHAWLQPGEVLLPPTCHTASNSSAQPGAEADHVTVTVGETCTAAAYSEGKLHRATLARLGALASQQFGPAYRLVSDARTEITGATVTSDQVTLRLHVSGVYAYRFSERQLAQLRDQLAGVSRDRASVVLARVIGVARVRLQSIRDVLPSDPGRIHILLSQ
jgi:hypothetical protein